MGLHRAANLCSPCLHIPSFLFGVVFSSFSFFFLFVLRRGGTDGGCLDIVNFFLVFFFSFLLPFFLVFLVFFPTFLLFFCLFSSFLPSSPPCFLSFLSGSLFFLFRGVVVMLIAVGILSISSLLSISFLPSHALLNCWRYLLVYFLLLFSFLSFLSFTSLFFLLFRFLLLHFVFVFFWRFLRYFLFIFLLFPDSFPSLHFSVFIFS